MTKLEKFTVLFMILSTIVLTALYNRPTTEVVQPVRVYAGDTMWLICNDNYIAENNAQGFNAFWSDNTKSNGSTLHPGDVVYITNKIYQ